MEQICKRCRRVCFSQDEFGTHECFNMDDLLDAEIAVCKFEREYQQMIDGLADTALRQAGGEKP